MLRLQIELLLKSIPRGDTGLTIFGSTLLNNSPKREHSEVMAHKLLFNQSTAPRNYIEAGSYGDIILKINSAMEVEGTFDLKSKYQ